MVTQYAPTPLLPRWRPSDSRTAKQTQRSSVPTLTAAAALRIKAALSKVAW